MRYVDCRCVTLVDELPINLVLTHLGNYFEIVANRFTPMEIGADSSTRFAMMTKRLPFALFIVAAMLSGPGETAESTAHGQALETVATTPINGLEGIDVSADGTMYVTDARAHVIYKVSPDGNVVEFSKAEVGAVQVILISPSGFVVTSQERDPDFSSFKPGLTPGAAGGPSPMGNLGAELLLLDKNGHILSKIDGPKGAFFNGIDRFGSDYLIADSVAGTIWRFDTSTGAITAWLVDEALHGPGGRFPGANGIKVVSGRVYVSNTSGGILYRIDTAKGAPTGGLIPVAHISADDFAVAHDGTIYVPVGTQVQKISPSGEITVIGDGCVGCDAALLSDHEHSLLFVTHGFGPNAGPGRIYKLKLN
jgi:sugar lactone lactonase YvrE